MLVHGRTIEYQGTEQVTDLERSAGATVSQGWSTFPLYLLVIPASFNKITKGIRNATYALLLIEHIRRFINTEFQRCAFISP